MVSASVSNSMAHYLIQSLDAALHERESFDCGSEALNRYFREQAGQDMKRKVCGCWVLFGMDEPERVLGYYTLSHEAVDARELPGRPDLLKKLPRYPRLPAVLLGRLAVSVQNQREGIGRKLLFDAISRCASGEIPSPLMLVDAKDAEAEAFYRRYGFEPITQRRLFFAMHSLRSGLGSPDSHR